MTPPERLYIDANIFIRVFEAHDELSSALKRLFLLYPPSRQPFLLTSDLTLAELLVVPIRKGDDQLIDRYNNWTTSNDYIEVGPIDRSVLWAAAVIRGRYASLKLPDAIHVATALRFGCAHFLTADLRLGGTYELDHSHWGQTYGPASTEVVRPDLPFIRDIVEKWAQ